MQKVDTKERKFVQTTGIGHVPAQGSSSSDNLLNMLMFRLSRALELVHSGCLQSSDTV